MGTALLLGVVPSANAISGQTFTIQLDAQPPVGQPWAFLRMFPGRLSVHRGDVVRSSNPVPSPSAVLAKAANQTQTATNVNGEAADQQAQTYTTKALSGGGTRYTLNAGGFSDNVTANEYLDNPLQVSVGDKIRF